VHPLLALEVDLTGPFIDVYGHKSSVAGDGQADVDPMNRVRTPRVRLRSSLFLLP